MCLYIYIYCYAKYAFLTFLHPRCLKGKSIFKIPWQVNVYFVQNPFKKKAISK